MKTRVLISFLSLLLFWSGTSFAADNSLVMNAPTSTGSYKQVQLQNAQVSCTASNVGMLYGSSTTNNLELCANVNGTPLAVTFSEVCFNRFWNPGTSCAVGDSSDPGCPTANYTEKINFADSFTPASGTTVCSTLCCSKNSAVSM